MQVRYTDGPNTALVADSGGSVFELSLKRGLRGPGATARCIFSGSRGEVCCMEPLRNQPYTHSSHTGSISKLISIQH